MSETNRFISIIQILDTMASSPMTDRKKLASIDFSPSLNQKNVDKVDTITQHILSDLRKAFSLDEMAEFIHMSPKSFSRFFKKNTGKTFVNYVNELRVEKACRLLLENDDSISNICFEVGFNTLSNFNRRFLEVKGLSPRDYRNHHNKTF
jgi:AraC-like DNA-binding protein